MAKGKKRKATKAKVFEALKSAAIASAVAKKPSTQRSLNAVDYDYVVIERPSTCSAYDLFDIVTLPIVGTPPYSMKWNGGPGCNPLTLLLMT